MAKLLFDHAIAGAHIHITPVLRGVLRYADKLLLVREPSNIYDTFAVRIDHVRTKSKLGYVPATHSQIVAGLIDGGVEVSASISDISEKHALVHFALWLNAQD